MAPSTSRATSSSSTATTQTVVVHNPPSSSTTQATQTRTTAPVLHLRGAAREQDIDSDEPTATRRRIQWAENVVDNEGMGKKKSKVCCIYHAPKGIDESSDESGSDSSSDSDSDSADDGAARPSRRKDCGHNHTTGKRKVKGKERQRSPNAYEKIPRRKDGGGREKD